MTKRTTIIDFVNEYVDKYQNDTYLREKVDGVWTETSFIKTRDEARLIAAGFMSLGLNKGDKVSLLAEARPMWVITEFGILFAGGVDVPLSYKPLGFPFHSGFRDGDRKSTSRNRSVPCHREGYRYGRHSSPGG